MRLQELAQELSKRHSEWNPKKKERKKDVRTLRESLRALRENP